MENPKDIEILLKFCEEHYTWCRHTEEQRSTMTNLIISITGALLAFVAFLGFTINALPIAIFLVILGIYGVIMILKFHERFRLHLELAGQWANRIDELCPNAELNLRSKKAYKKHGKKYNKLKKIKLYRFWVFIHVLISLMGVGLIIIILLNTIP